MTAFFELMFKYRPLLYERGEICFRPSWPAYVTWIIAALALAAAYLLYRHAGLSGPWRFVLPGLRASALLIILLLLLEPTLLLKSVIPQKNFVAIAYDMSRSMEIKDGPGGQSRLQVQRNLLRPEANPLIRDLSARFKLRYFSFSRSAERTEAFADQPRHGQSTGIYSALHQIAGEFSAAPLAGIVLITDGADNRSGDSALTGSGLKSRNIPVYTIGIGSPEVRQDIEVLRVIAPKKVLKGTTVEAEVSVRSKGYAGRHATLAVLDGDRQLQSRAIALGGDDDVKTYKISFTSETVGARVLDFRVSPFSDELIPENNSRTAVMRFDDDRPQILYVEGEPRWEYGFLRRAVQTDKNLHLITLLRQADGKFLRQGVESTSTLEKGFPVLRSELFRYKGLILGSIEASFFTFDQLRMISDFVAQRGGGFLMLGGKNSFGQGGYSNTPVEDMLPLALQPDARGVRNFQDLEFKLQLTGYGWQHPAIRLGLLDDANRNRWEGSPALRGYNPTAGPKPGATVLAQGSVSDTGGHNPAILAFQRFGRGKAIAFATASSWRWRMGLAHTDNFHEVFWKQLIRWLVGDVPDPVAVFTENSSYPPDEPVFIRAEVSDDSFIPLNGAQVTAQVKSPSGQIDTVELTWDAEREGSYSGAYRPAEEGVYEIVSEAFQGDRSLGQSRHSFQIADSMQEYHDASMNSSLLKRISADTGGRYYSNEDIRTLPEDISYVDKGVFQIEERDLWDMPFIFLLLIGCVSTEWIFRKRKGLA